jgi:hypothetical protein
MDNMQHNSEHALSSYPWKSAFETKIAPIFMSYKQNGDPYEHDTETKAYT